MNNRMPIFKVLSSYSPITDLVSDRIYYVMAPQGVVYPYIVFSLEEVSKLSGNHGDLKFITNVYQLDVMSKDLAIAESLAFLVQERMHLVSGVFGGYEILNCMLDGESNFFEDDLKAYRFSQTYTVNFNE